MHPIFSITVEDIQALGDTEARELVARLCRAELRASGISSSAVTWGGDQRAQDGGVDVRISVPDKRNPPEIIKASEAGLQVKAEKFPPSKIDPEMAPKGKIRPAIVELAKAGGAYVIVSTRDSLSDSSLKLRRDAMEQCLKKRKLKARLKIDFYDARKIADWADSHPAIIAWLRHTLGKPLMGWSPYGPWAYKETTTEASYLIDERVKIFTPDQDEGSDILQAIARLRRELSQNTSVRIVGLSGVGKTRLAQALFDQRAVPDAKALEPEHVIYTDLSDNPTPQPHAMLEALATANADCVVVVDNCGPETHQRLTEIVKRPASKLRLLTIEYDIRDDLPESTSLYRLEGSSDGVIKDLLRREYGFLSNVDLETIATFSDGNARVAFALASTSSSTGELGRLRDAELFRRLFQQSNAESDELLKCAEAASLLYSFDGEDTSPESELSVLAGIAGISIPTMTRAIAELQRRGLLQRRGIWRALLPHAIANRLAARAIEASSEDTLLQTLVKGASERVARSFSRRLGYLHGSGKAQSVARSWLKSQGQLGDLRTINELGRQIFANIAPIDMDAALGALERAVQDPGFVAVQNHDRYNFARTARSLAYEPELFVRAASVLAKFALAEPVNHNSNSTRDMLKSLFHIHLSGTQATPEQRREVIEEALNSDAQEMRQLGMSLLDAALEATHFSSVYSFEFGTRKRDYGWWPRTRGDVKGWFDLFIKLAVRTAEDGSKEDRQEVRAVLGESVRGLITHGRVISNVAEAAKTLKAKGGWPEGWLGVRRILQWDKAELNEADLKAVKEIEALLAPTDLRVKIAAKVLSRGSFSDDVDDDESLDASARYTRSALEAEELGKAAAHAGNLIPGMIDELFSNNGNDKLWNFGFGVGQEAKNPHSILDLAKAQIENAKPGTLSLIFLRGLISGWHKSNPEAVSKFLDGALTDEVWSAWFPELQLRFDLDDNGFSRIIKSLELGKSPSWQYRYLGMGRVTDALSVEQISELVGGVSQLPEKGLEIAVDLMAMVILCAKEKDAHYREELGQVCEAFLERIDWDRYPSSDDSTDHDMGVILEFSLSSSVYSAKLAHILQRLLDRDRNALNNYARHRGHLLAPFFRFFPTEALDAVYVQDKGGGYRTAIRMVSDPYRENSETAIRKAPDEKLIEWCNRSPQDRFIFAAQVCRLLTKLAREDGKDEVSLSATAVLVLAHAPDTKAMLEIFLDRFQPRSWSGRLADILQSRLPLLQMLNPKNDPAVQVEIDRARHELERQIAVEIKREDDEERNRTGSFE